VNRSTRQIIALCWAAGLVGLSFLTIHAGTPTPLSPLNLCVVIPAFWSVGLLGQGSLLFAMMFVPALFLAWSWSTVSAGAARIPVRSAVLFSVVAFLSVGDLVFGSQYGVQYQGRDYVAAVWMINVPWWIGLSTLIFVADKWPRPWLNLTFHFAFFAWLAWCALPYLGELP
jgi:hypothetical protein